MKEKTEAERYIVRREKKVIEKWEKERDCERQSGREREGERERERENKRGSDNIWFVCRHHHCR